LSALDLTLDLGNSACKVCAWSGEEADPVSTGAFPWSDEGWSAGLAAWIRAEGTFGGAALSSVTTPERAERVLAMLGDLSVMSPDCGLEILCKEPGEVGTDRLFAARGALEFSPRAVVVDLGTALTVDAVDGQGGSGGRFLGGAIAPGPAVLTSALSAMGERLFPVQPRLGALALGRDTREALEAGLTIGLRGAARALVEGAMDEAGFEDAQVFVTGGGALLLFEPDHFMDRPLTFDPHLVHRGLRAALAGV